jgi:hypothetical protein
MPEDHLTQDAPLRGQNYYCVSFVSPEEVIKKKEVAFFEAFIESFQKDVTDLFDVISKHPKFADDSSVTSMIQGIKNANDYLFCKEGIIEQYKYFVRENSDRLEREYHEANNFQTSVRGIKMRGAYDNLFEAKKRCEDLQKIDPIHNIYVAQVGCWCPWDPSSTSIDDQTYAEDGLNELVKGYKENNAKVKGEFSGLRPKDWPKIGDGFS